MPEEARTEELVQKAYRLGYEYEQVYRGCSQCVLAAIYDALGVQNDPVFKAATGLAGGGGLTGDTGCGAYSGAILALGSFMGRERSDFKDEKGLRFRSHAMARKLHTRFIQEFGSAVCRDIQSRLMGRPFYLADSDDFRKFDEAGGHSEKCPQVVGKAAQWAVEILAEEGLLP